MDDYDRITVEKNRVLKATFGIYKTGTVPFILRPPSFLTGDGDIGL